jgi:hypothetical protein
MSAAVRPESSGTSDAVEVAMERCIRLVQGCGPIVKLRLIAGFRSDKGDLTPPWG